MAFDFPSSPTNGQEYTSGAITYVWNGTSWAIKGANASFVLKAGDTMVGNLAIKLGAPALSLNKTVDGSGASLFGLFNDKLRWAVQPGSGMPESTGNAGSDFRIYRYNDDGSMIATPSLIIDRATSAATFGGTVQANLFLFANKTATANIGVAGKMNGVLRWEMQLGNAVAETGSGNVGSDFSLWRCADDGSYAGAALTVNRASGKAQFNGAGLVVNSTDYNHIRLRSTGYSTLLHNNGTQFYFLATAVGDPDGGYSAIRPFRIDLDTGIVTMAHNVGIGGTLTAGASSFNGIVNVNDRFRVTNSVADWAAIVLQQEATNAGMYIRIQSTTNIALGILRNDGAVWLHQFLATGNYSCVGAITCSGLLTSGTVSTGRIDCTICYFGSGIYWNHEAGNARLASNQNVYSYGYVNAAGGMRCESTFITAANAWVYGGVLYMSSGGHYFNWDGSNYAMPHGNLYIMGALALRSGADATVNSFTANANVDCGGGNYYYVHNGGIFTRWRGDLGRIEFSHPINAWDIVNNGNYASKYAGNTWHFNWGGDPGLNAYIDNGNWGNILNSQSDYRLKKDVTPLHSMWEIVKGMRPVKFTGADWAPYSQDDGIERWGLIAHELQEDLLPSAATGHKDCDGAPQQPHWPPIVAVLTKALQEAMSRIEQLEGRIAHA